MIIESLEQSHSTKPSLGRIIFEFLALGYLVLSSLAITILWFRAILLFLTYIRSADKWSTLALPLLATGIWALSFLLIRKLAK